jgi:flagellar assembly protein FliH
MIWSFSPPRVVARDASETVPAQAWAPEELPSDPQSRPMNRLSSASVSSPDEDALRAELEDRAFMRGYEEGARAGAGAEAERLQSAVHALRDAHQAVIDGAGHWTGNAEANICALAIAVAEHILGPELTVSREALLATVRQALQEFPVDQALIVRLNPGDHAFAMAAVEGPETGGARRETQWVADPRIAAGGCLVEGRERIIDGRIDTALERLYRRLAASNA